MISILPKETDITQAFNHFAQRKCINHQRRKAFPVCLHEDCWKPVVDEAFFCEDCNVNHVMKHRNSMRFNALFMMNYSKNVMNIIKIQTQRIN